jgi:hypothetical protein
MNAKTAHYRALRNMEGILWEQLPDYVRLSIEEAVRGEYQHVTLTLQEGNNPERAVSNLRMLGYEAYTVNSTDGVKLSIDW